MAFRSEQAKSTNINPQGGHIGEIRQLAVGK